MSDCRGEDVEYLKYRIMRVSITIIILTVTGGLLIMCFNTIQGNKKKQTAELTEYFESVSGVRIKDLCIKEDGEITHTRKSEKVDICFTLRDGCATLLESRFKETGHSVVRDSGSLPGLEGYQFADKFKQEDILGWYSLFETVKKPFGVRTSAEVLIYITKDQSGIEHVYVFK